MKASVGKRVGGGLYVHRTAVGLLPSYEAQTLSLASQVTGDFEWNVVRIAKDSVTFLLYESFDDAAFPALLESLKVDEGGREVNRCDYRKRTNPPILHRKELLLLPDDVRLPRFRALTRAAEEYGLFKDCHKIGTRTAWEQRIAEAGLVVRGHSLVPCHEKHIEVSRHKTAIVRRDLSQPMQIMLRLGIVTPERTVFDYGCGQGEDISALLSQGCEAFGWDPHHAEEGRREAADVVNLGFVLNVIEDAHERLETLMAAWGFAKRVLCVSVMVQGRVVTSGQKPHRDGFLTSRCTFQKYFTQQELRELVGTVAKRSPLSLAPGIVAVFKDEELEQEVLLRRRSRVFNMGVLPRPPVRERELPCRPKLNERLASVIEALREPSLWLGRAPRPEEVPPSIKESLSRYRVAWPRVVALLEEELAKDKTFVEASRSRREDLLVHMALQQFPGSPKYRSLPLSVQTDIKVFYGNLSSAQTEAKRLLFTAGDRAGIRIDAEGALASGIGGLRGRANFRFHSSVLSRLPPRLRVLVGCAEVLQGGAVSCDFVDLDLEKPRVSMITCDDIGSAVPFVIERVKVDLGRLKVHSEQHEPGALPIYFKSRFLPVDFPGRTNQIAFESALSATGLFEADAPEPKWATVLAVLRPVNSA